MLNLIKTIEANPQESRKAWRSRILEDAGRKNSNTTVCQFWQQDNHPIVLKGSWINEKLGYIHNNPVGEGWVNEPEDTFIQVLGTMRGF